MTGNALKNTEQFEFISREPANKLFATRRLTLRESKFAVISPNNSRPTREKTTPGSSFQ